MNARTKTITSVINAPRDNNIATVPIEITLAKKKYDLLMILLESYNL